MGDLPIGSVVGEKPMNRVPQKPAAGRHRHGQAGDDQAHSKRGEDRVARESLLQGVPDTARYGRRYVDSQAHELFGSPGGQIPGRIMELLRRGQVDGNKPRRSELLVIRLEILREEPMCPGPHLPDHELVFGAGQLDAIGNEVAVRSKQDNAVAVKLPQDVDPVVISPEDPLRGGPHLQGPASLTQRNSRNSRRIESSTCSSRSRRRSESASSSLGSRLVGISSRCLKTRPSDGSRSALRPARISASRKSPTVSGPRLPGREHKAGDQPYETDDSSD